MEDHPRYALSYRATETRQVMEWIEAGQSGHILGLRGAGKSNFIRFLLRAETQQHYLGQDQANFIFVLVNLLALTERAEWGIYEMLINNVLAELRPPDMAAETIAEITSLQQNVLHDRDAQIAQRAVERCVSLLCQGPARRLVFLFDEFDAVFRELPASAFRCLRAIRDAHKDQISYIVFSKRDLADLRNDLTDDLDQFHRLVSRNFCGLGPYNEADARQMIRYLASRRATGLSEKDATRLLELSGGHAGLLKTLLSLLWSADGAGDLAKPVPALAGEPVVALECQKLWENRADAEKAALCYFSNGHPLDAPSLKWLQLRGLLRQSGADAPAFFSPLFAAFVRSQAIRQTKGTFISRSPQIVQIDGQRIETLTGLEFELLCYLYEQRGRACTKHDLIENVYRQHYEARRGGLTDAMLQKLISRLREKIEPDCSQPRYIVTVHGEGYKFVLPDET